MDRSEFRESTKANVPASAMHEIDVRRRRRYDALVARQLPDWAKNRFGNQFRDALFSLHCARLSVRCPDVFGSSVEEDPARDYHAHDNEKRCASRLLRLMRLCTYHAELEGAWKTIASTPIVGKPYSNALLDEQAVTSLVLYLIDDIAQRFEHLPKHTPATRKRSLGAVVKAVDALLEAMHASPEADLLAGTWLADYFGLKNVEMRASAGERLYRSDLLLPARFAIKPHKHERTSDEVESPAAPAWTQWPSADQYAWLSNELEETTLAKLLSSYRSEIAWLIEEKAPIAQPGRADKGFLPFFIRALSNVMHMLYSTPLDNTVALLASAVMNLSEPLSRDDVRAYTKKPGKN